MGAACGSCRQGDGCLPDAVGRDGAGLELTPNVEYCTGGERPQLMNIIRPKDRTAAPLPAVLWIHSGGRVGGSQG